MGKGVGAVKDLGNAGPIGPGQTGLRHSDQGADVLPRTLCPSEKT